MTLADLASARSPSDWSCKKTQIKILETNVKIVVRAEA